MPGLIWLLALCLPLSAFAQTSLNHQAWSVEEGLPQAGVHQVFQSHDGYLWLATEGGVARFDGYGFKTYNQQSEPAFLSNDVTSIAEAAGDLWFGTENGLLRYRRGLWNRFDERDGLPSSTILSLAAASQGELLVLTSGGLVRSRGQGFQPVATGSANISALQTVFGSGVLLLGDTEVLAYRDGALQRYSAALPAKSSSATIQGVQQAANGTVWTRTARSVSMRKPGVQLDLVSGLALPRGRVSALLVDKQGTAWIGTSHGLFFLQAKAGAKLQQVESMRQESVLCLLEDREGNLWAGTQSSGLHALRPSKFSSESAAAGEAVSAVTGSTDGTLWFGTEDDGVRHVQDARAVQPVPVESLTSTVVLAMALGPNNDLWVGTPDGLNRLAGHHVERFTSSTGLPDDYVRSLLVERRGTAWAGTRRGLVRVEGEQIKIYTKKDGLGSDSIGPLLQNRFAQRASNAIQVPDLWVGTAAGLSHLHGGVIENVTADAAPGGNVVSAIAQQADGTLWVGLHGRGLYLMAENRLKPVRVAALPNEVLALATDTVGYLWIRGPYSVYRASLSSLQACASKASQCDFAPDVYGIADGLPSDTVSSLGVSTIWQDTDGKLFFPTRKGIGSVDPLHLPLNRIPPPVAIEEFAVDEADLPLGNDDLNVSSGHHRYTFQFAALSYTLPSRNRYRYRLDGFDNHWIDSGPVRLASYTGLAPGQYRFRVEAQNNDGLWSAAAAELRFRIQPPVYRTWWFLCLMVLLVTALAASAFWLHTRSVQGRFRLILAERTRIARDVHDTLAQDLVSVSLQLSLAKRYVQTNHLEQATLQLDATKTLVSQGLEAVRQSIWNLRADTAEDSLPTRLTQAVRQYAQQEHPPRLKIGGAFRRLKPSLEAEVLCIAQEALSNAYRHAGATEVSIALRYETDTLVLTIHDNGRGFSMEKAQHMHGHYGLLGMRERADALRAQLTVTTRSSEGTTIDLTVPLSEGEHRSA